MDIAEKFWTENCNKSYVLVSNFTVQHLSFDLFDFYYIASSQICKFYSQNMEELTGNNTEFIINDTLLYTIYSLTWLKTFLYQSWLLVLVSIFYKGIRLHKALLFCINSTYEAVSLDNLLKFYLKSKQKIINQVRYYTNLFEVSYIISYKYEGSE